MPELIVLAFDNMDEAEKVHHSMHAEDKIGYLDLKDSAVIVCDEDGKVNIKNEVSDGAKAGALWGGLIGILLAGFVFPLAVIAVSAVVGAFIGRSVTGDYVSKDFVNEVKEKLQPGTSAIFLIFRGSDVGHAIATLRPYKGTVLHTTLSDEAEKSLKDELKKRGTK
jgi:uncharacterized membrane protein